MQISSAKDKNPVQSDMTFYGVIKEIWELDYITTRIPVFFCDWVKSDSSIIYEDFGFTLVNLNRLGHKSDRFIMAAQAKQVFYVNDPLDNQWSIVLTTPTKEWNTKDGDLHDIPIEEESIIFTSPICNDEIDDDGVCLRDNCEGLWIDNLM